jgi:chorismate synthase
VDELGQLLILHDPSVWHPVADYDGTADEVAARRLEIDKAAEDSFLSMSDADAAALPSYEAADGKIYNRNGVELPALDDAQLKACRSVALLNVRCPHATTCCKMASLIRQVKSEQDSIGGTVIGHVTGMPVGLGEPCFDKLEANLAHGMLSIPATKGFEFGSGFDGCAMRGSQHNDQFKPSAGVTDGIVTRLRTTSNNAGGTLGGISNGEDIYFRVAVKPVSTIGRAQQTSTYDGKSTELEAKGRHDPCVLPRTPPLVESMAALVLMDAALMQKTREHQGGVDPSEGYFPASLHPIEKYGGDGADPTTK